MDDPVDGTPLASTDTSGELMLRLYAERACVTRRAKATGLVRASAITRLRDHEVIEELAREQVEIVHVPIGREVDACPPVRVDGDTTILSIVEEMVVVQRRLVLTEEVHMTKVRTTRAHRQTVQLREQRAVITRKPADPD